MRHSFNSLCLTSGICLFVACGGGGATDHGSGTPTDDGGTAGPQPDSGGPGSVDGSAVPPDSTMPALSPTLLFATYAGGAGDQFVQDVGFDEHGVAYANGKGFSVTFDPMVGTGQITGDVTQAMDMATFKQKPDLPKGGLSTNTLVDPRNGQTYTWGTHPNVAKSGVLCPSQCAGTCTVGQAVTPLLQMAFLKSSAGWHDWDFSWSDCVNSCVIADSRGYDLWLSARGEIAGMWWTDGGDTPMKRDPKDVSKESSELFKGSFGTDPGGMGTLFFRADPVTGNVLSGTWLATHVVFHTHDDWGRVYLTKAIAKRYGVSDNPDPKNPFGMSTKASSGLMVLTSDLRQPEMNAYIGGDPATCADTMNGIQILGAIQRRGNLVVLGGTTCATDFATSANAVQKKHGGGQDAFIAVVKLWN